MVHLISSSILCEQSVALRLSLQLPLRLNISLWNFLNHLQHRTLKKAITINQFKSELKHGGMIMCLNEVSDDEDGNTHFDNILIHCALLATT